MSIDWTSAEMVDAYRFVRVSWPDMKEHEELGNVVGGSQEENYLTSAKVTAKLDYIDGLDVRRDLVRVYYEAEDTSTGRTAEVALGTFFVSTPSETLGDATISGSADCYSVLTVLVEGATHATYTVSKGSNAVAKAVSICTALYLHVVSTACPTVTTSAASWPAGTSWMEIVNWLLDIAGYGTAGVDGYGNVTLRPYTAPSTSASVLTLSDDSACVFERDMEVELDSYDTPNVVIVTLSRDDLALSSVATNADPKSPWSVPSRGREVARVESVSDLGVDEDGLSGTALTDALQSALDAKASALLVEGASEVESVEVTHVWAPFDVGQVVRVVYSAAGLDAPMSAVKRRTDYGRGALSKTRFRRFVVDPFDVTMG